MKVHSESMMEGHLEGHQVDGKYIMPDIIASYNRLHLFTEVEIAIEAFIYSFPMMVNLLMLFENSVWPHAPGYFPMNTFTAPNRTLDWHAQTTDPALEVLHSRVWLDLEKHPIVLNIPDIPKEVCGSMRRSDRSWL